jgi:hypothetical protein
MATLHCAAFSFVDSLLDGSGIRRPLSSRFLLFLSLFDGAATQYLSDFGALIPDQVDSIWGQCVLYPGARDLGAFSTWIGSHQFTLRAAPDTQLEYVFNGYNIDPVNGAPDPRPPVDGAPELASMPLILNALNLRQRLRRLRALWKRNRKDPFLLQEVLELGGETPIGTTR